jgi:hypothetical protein
LVTALLAAASGARAETFFSTGNADGKMAAASQPAGAASIETEAADDFVLTAPTALTAATFTGLIPNSASVSAVVIEIYRVFPADSNISRSPNVPTRTNSPADVAFDSRSVGATLRTVTMLGASTALNSVVAGIYPEPNQTTGGDGFVSGNEVVITATLNPPIALPAGHYFFVPQVALTSGTFLWLSAPRPIVAPGTPFTGDLQSWIRNANLTPDWLRIGTDIVGGATPPTFNHVFTLSDDVIFRNGFE